METPLVLGEVLRRQHQVITRRQALECGIGHDTIHRRARPGGSWQRLLPGVLLTVTGTPTADQRDMAALLYAGPGGTLTGPAALRRHGIGDVRSDIVDVLIPAKRTRQSTGLVLLHQTTRLPPMVCYQGPIQYALAARAVTDAARAMTGPDEGPCRRRRGGSDQALHGRATRSRASGWADPGLGAVARSCRRGRTGNQVSARGRALRPDHTGTPASSALQSAAVCRRRGACATGRVVALLRGRGRGRLASVASGARWLGGDDAQARSHDRTRHSGPALLTAPDPPGA